MRRLLAAVACVLSLLAAPAFAEDAYTFKVKGVVRGLPGDGRAANEILVKHEVFTHESDGLGFDPIHLRDCGDGMPVAAHEFSHGSARAGLGEDEVFLFVHGAFRVRL